MDFLQRKLHGGRFARCHPLVIFLYFVFVLLMTMFCMHPVMLAESLIIGILYASMCRKMRNIAQYLCCILPIIGATALLNPLFNHGGKTIIFKISGVSFTLEAVLFGMSAAAMLCAVLIWFLCWNEVLTADKLMALFGRILPSATMLLTMVMRFVPMLAQRMRMVFAAQKCIAGLSDESLAEKNAQTRKEKRRNLILQAKIALRCVSSLLSDSLERSVMTADSMKCRGYGLPGRTNFVQYRWTKFDSICAILICAFGGASVAGFFFGWVDCIFYPSVSMRMNWQAVGTLICYALLCALPMILEGIDILKWKHSS